MLIAVAGAWALGEREQDKPRLGLLTTMPIYWGETLAIGEAIEGGTEPHWARAALEEDYRFVPLDTLDGASPPLGELDYLLLAQPRALSPAENVALDEWVRAGGRVLVFADPLLTGESRFGIGDRRRRQDVILLSPILRRWGLDLRFDPEQSDGLRSVRAGGAAVPVSQAGALVKVPSSAPSTCTLAGEGLVAECTIGEGRAVVVADAALLELPGDQADTREALDALSTRAFGR